MRCGIFFVKRENIMDTNCYIYNKQEAERALIQNPEQLEELVADLPVGTTQPIAIFDYQRCKFNNLSGIEISKSFITNTKFVPEFWNRYFFNQQLIVLVERKKDTNNWLVVFFDDYIARLDTTLESMVIW